MSVLLGKRRAEVIDTHVHTFPDAIAPGAIGKIGKISGITPFTNGTVSDTLQKLGELQIDRAVLLNIATAPRQQTTINNCAAALQAEWGDRLIPFGSVHYDAPDAVAELARIRSLGLRGIKLHPDYQDFFIDDERLFPIYEACEALGLVVVFHSGWDCYSPALIHAEPAASRRMLRRFPKLKAVLAHFGGLRQWDEVERWLIGEDVWLDTSMCASYADRGQIERLIRLHGPERVLFASDCPWENPGRSLDFVRNMELSDEEKAGILAGNARRLLGLDPPAGQTALGQIVTVTVDRPLGSRHPRHLNLVYPVNYGYVAGEPAPDGEPQDAYLLGVDHPVEQFTGVVAAIVRRRDDVEEKWIVTPPGLRLSREEMAEQVRFQEQWFDSEIQCDEREQPAADAFKKS